MKTIKTDFKLILFFSFISIIFTANPIVVIPFKVNSFSRYQSNSNYNSTNFISDYFYMDFYTNIITGIPSKSILALLDTNSHIFKFKKNYLDRKTLEEIDDPEHKISKQTYISSQSHSFQNISEFRYSNLELKKATLCSETFLLYKDLLMEKTVPVQNLQFIIDDNEGKELNIRVGLNKPLTKDYLGPPHFIQSLLDTGMIKDQSWTIKFLSENDGIFVLGEEPHQYQDPEKDKRYQRKYYFKCNSLTGNEYYNPLSISAQKVFAHNKKGEEIIINENKGCYLNYNYGFIIGTKEYKEYIDRNFFDKLIELKICSYDFVHYIDKDDIEFRYYSIRCDKDEFKEYYEKFPKLNFFVYDYNYNFELTKEDLFVKVNHEYYFLIIFQKSIFDHSDLAFWNLGLPFLKKYEFVHNYVKQNIGFYIPYQEPEEDDDDEKIPEKPPKEAEKEKEKEKKEEKKDSNENTKSYALIIVGAIIIVIILVVGAFCVAKNMYEKRKGKANELEDDFVYNSENKEKKTIN